MPERLKFTRGKCYIADEHGRPVKTRTQPDPILIAALSSAHRLLASVDADIGKVERLTIEEAPKSNYDRMKCRIAFLAPDLQQMILEGRQPPDLNLASFITGGVPCSWEEQRKVFAIPC